MRFPNNTHNRSDCFFNVIHTKYNEDFGADNSYSYSFEYPSFHIIENTNFNINPNILANINNVIHQNVDDFKSGLFAEDNQFEDGLLASSNYAVTFNKNYILSTILSFMGIVKGEPTPLYNQINNFNYDLITGNTISLKDVFKNDIDYVEVVKKYVNYKISQNKDLFYENYDLYIPNDQAFYLTDDAIIIYFGVDEIAPASSGVPKFRMSFEKFAPYISPRFYCSVKSRGLYNKRFSK